MTDAKPKYVGRSMLRKEDEPLLKGQGRFAADVNFPNQLHMRVVRSSFAHGRLLAVDLAPALAIPGVHAVITAVEIGAVNGNSRLVWRTFTAFGNMTTLIANSWPSVY